MTKKAEARRHELRSPGLTEPKAASCTKAAIILKVSHESADALLKAFELAQTGRSAARGLAADEELAQTGRGAPRGMTTDEEQDLLRAMLVMAAAGLDSMLKQLIRDCMPSLVKANPQVREGLEKFVARSIRGDADVSEPLAGARFLARVLTAESQQGQVIEEYIRDLTGVSLQSAPELIRTVQALGLSKTKVDAGRFKAVFAVRNEIIHELDINLDNERRRRNLRRRGDMMEDANALLEMESRSFAKWTKSWTRSNEMQDEPRPG